MTGGTGTIGLVDSAREENLNRTQDLIIHDPAHRGANGAAMPTDEDNQDGHFFYYHPERGATSLPRRAQPLLLLFRSNPPTGGGASKNVLAMPTDEDDQDGHFFYNHPERGPTSPPRRAQPLFLLSRSNPPH